MRKALTLPFLVFLFAMPASAQLTTRVVKDSLFIPWEICYAADGRLWFTQKNGYICRVAPATGFTDTVYQETATVVQGEGGMLGMALHPQFPAQPYVYAAHNYLTGGLYKVRIVRYTYDGLNALGSRLILLEEIAGSQNHNGCRLAIIGDKLFATTGDAENLANPQNVTSRNGKVLRLNLDGSYPSDNPNPSTSYIWSWGHRNAQGLTFYNGILYSTEHGPNNDDEINIIKKGRNYGWPTVQGFCNTAPEQAFCADSNVVEPLYAWTPTIATSAVQHYHHPMFPQFAGSLMMSTLKDQKLYQLQLNAAGTAVTNVSTVAGVSFGRLRGICISPQGRIYISTSNSTASGTGAKVDKIVELYDPTYVPAGVGDPAVGTAPKIYPNPVTDQLKVEGGGSEAYRITSIDGRIGARGILKNGSVIVSGLAPGIYVLDVVGIGKCRFVKSE